MKNYQKIAPFVNKNRSNDNDIRDAELFGAELLKNKGDI